jgi:hypothetical protein
MSARHCFKIPVIEETASSSVTIPQTIYKNRTEWNRYQDKITRDPYNITRDIAIVEFNEEINILPDTFTEKMMSNKIMFFKSTGTSNPGFNSEYADTWLPLLGVGIIIDKIDSTITIKKFFHKYKSVLSFGKANGWGEDIPEEFKSKKYQVLYNTYIPSYRILSICAYLNINYNFYDIPGIKFPIPNFFTNNILFSNYVLTHKYSHNSKQFNEYPEDFSNIKSVKIYNTDMCPEVDETSQYLLEKIKNMFCSHTRFNPISATPYRNLFYPETRQYFEKTLTQICSKDGCGINIDYDEKDFSFNRSIPVRNRSRNKSRSRNNNSSNNSRNNSRYSKSRKRAKKDKTPEP